MEVRVLRYGNGNSIKEIELLGETRELVSLGCICSWELDKRHRVSMKKPGTRKKASSSYEEAPADAGASSSLDSYETCVL
jgi:hypothetical protein